MSNVMGLQAAGGIEPGSSSAVRKVREASRLFAWLFTALVVCFGALVAAMAIAMLAYTGPHLQVTPHSFELTELSRPLKDGVIFGALPLGTKLAYALVAVVRSLPALMIFIALRGLFGLYARGIVFAPETSERLKQVGLWLVAAAFAPFACHLFLTAVGAEMDHAWFHASEVQELVLGGLVFVIAQVMQVGREIEEDRSQFV